MVVLELGSISMATALSLLVACYYVFNIMYPTKCSNAYLFCEAALLEIHHSAKKRVAVNKFISALKVFGFQIAVIRLFMFQYTMHDCDSP